MNTELKGEEAPESQYESPWSEILENDVIMDPEGYSTLLAIYVRIKERLSYVREPKDIPEIPEEYFLEGTPQEIRELVRQKLMEMLEAAKPHQTSILASVNRNSHIEDMEDPDVKALHDKFGHNSYRLAGNLSWYANLCGGDVPSRLTPDFIKHVHDLGLSAAHFLNTQTEDPEFAGKIKAAYSAVADKNIVPQEVWASISELEPTEFVKELYNYLGVHIGFQGLQQDELDRLKFEDLKRIRQFMLAGPAAQSQPAGSTWEKFRQKWMPTQRERRSLNTMNPEIYIGFDRGLFKGLSAEEQSKAFDELNAQLGDMNLRVLGAIQIFDKALRTATIKDEDNARKIGAEPVRVTLHKPGSEEVQYCDVCYDNPEDFRNRTIQWNLVNNNSKDEKTGLAVGYVFPL